MNVSIPFYKFSLLLFFVTGSLTILSAQEVTGLEGFTIFIDQGHSGKENVGVFGYTEAEKSLRVGLELQRLLMNKTDIDTAYVARTNDTMEVTLTQRTDLANALDVDFYYSIHSDAAQSTTVNSTLFLHGGWRSNGKTVEKTPEGGKDFGDIMEPILTSAMQTNTRGNYADRTFYQGIPDHHDNQFPYLHVNRESNMASLLSEAGFHTTPYQNQRNMNAGYKRLEARAAFWTILEYLGAERPVEGILAGEIKDYDLERFANGLSVTVQDTTIVTDTYESLFYKYTSDPDLLSNGYFYIDGLTPGITDVIIGGEGYFNDTIQVEIKETEITFLDTIIRNSALPAIISTEPGDGDTLKPGDLLVIHFNKKMDTLSVEEAFTIMPEVDFDFIWENRKTLGISTSEMQLETDYTIIIAEGPSDESKTLGLDGNGDGEEGGDFIFHIRTADIDTMPPVVVDIYPDSAIAGTSVIVGITFDKLIDHDSIPENMIYLKSEKSDRMLGEMVIHDVRDRSVVSFFPEDELEKNIEYTIVVLPGYEDLNGNKSRDTLISEFTTGDLSFDSVIEINDFEDGLAPFWQPSQSGSTTGIIVEETKTEQTSDITNLLSGSTGAMRLNYGFFEDQTGLIRVFSPDKTPVYDDSYTLQSYVFGDGSGNRFRMVVRDENGELEASKWIPVVWRGWRLISWNMGEDEVVPFANGDGVVDGKAYFDSYQLAYVKGQPNTGFMIFDDLKAVGNDVPTFTRNTKLPDGLALQQNFPNPVLHSTRIGFSIPERNEVRLDVSDVTGRHIKTLVSGVKMKGEHFVDFNTSQLSSGIYYYHLLYGTYILTGKMVVAE